MWSPLEGTAVGRDHAGQLIRYVHQNAFDAQAEVKNLLVDEGKTTIEADFVGTHAGEFAGIQPTGRAVRVPYSVLYDLRGDKISGLWIYSHMPASQRAISAVTGGGRPLLDFIHDDRTRRSMRSCDLRGLSDESRRSGRSGVAGPRRLVQRFEVLAFSWT
jgi:hypothetical protein